VLHNCPCVAAAPHELSLLKKSMKFVLCDISSAFVCLVNYRKDSTRLGESFLAGIPIEVIPFAYVPIMNKIKKLFGGEVELRMARRKAVCMI